MIVRDHTDPEIELKLIARSNAIKVSDLKPEPKENYTVTYERIVLSDDFELTKIQSSNVYVDLWLTKPPFPKVNVAANVETISITGEFNLRDLSDNVSSIYYDFTETPSSTNYFATVASMGMDAIGPQEDLLYKKDTDWTPKIYKHTNFSVVQKEIRVTTSPPYVGGTLTIPLNPRENGDLLSNMYFKCKLPPNVNYTKRVGRALFEKVELCFNEFVIQRYDDNWARIHDELFMSADESLVLDEILEGPDLIIPFKFFFCEKDQYLPLCALTNQMIYIKIYFNKQSWFTDFTGNLDITEPSIIFDQIFLTTEERNYYKLKSHQIIIPYVENETPQLFNKGSVTINMSASFNVSMLTWFIRNQNYETDPVQYDKRYSYGYVSDLVKSYTSFVNWKGETVYYVPVIDYVDLFINNVNIIKGLTGDLYYTYKQPMEHGLSVPDTTIYTYCFSEEPKNPLKRGDVDFRTLASKTTNLKIKFLESYVPQLSQSYYLYLYYFGYRTLSIDRGFGVLLA